MPNTRRRCMIGFGTSREEFERRLAQPREGERIIVETHSFPPGLGTRRWTQSQPPPQTQNSLSAVEAPPPYGSAAMDHPYSVDAGAYGPAGPMPGAHGPSAYGLSAYAPGAYGSGAYGVQPPGVNLLTRSAPPPQPHAAREAYEMPPPMYGVGAGIWIAPPSTPGGPLRCYPSDPNSGPPFRELTAAYLPGATAQQPRMTGASAAPPIPDKSSKRSHKHPRR